MLILVKTSQQPARAVGDNLAFDRSSFKPVEITSDLSSLIFPDSSRPFQVVKIAKGTQEVGTISRPTSSMALTSSLKYWTTLIVPGLLQEARTISILPST